MSASPWPDPQFDPLGLAGAGPRPGWAVLDAARDASFSGELEFATQPAVRVYLDAGRIYVAERVTDPPVGARLVDAGALDAAQLASGTVRIGDQDHLGRLFERAPTVDRTAVLVTLEMMTEEATAWVANQVVRSVTVTPYRHHPSGIHRWEAAPAYLDLPPGSPLPAPTAASRPVAPPVEALADLDELGADIRIEWAETATLHERLTVTTAPAAPAAPAGPAAAASAAVDVAPTPATTPDAPAAPQLGVAPVPAPDERAAVAGERNGSADLLDGFEVIWPTGEVDEHFPAPVAEAEPAPSGSSMRVGAGRSASGDEPAPGDDVRFVLPTQPSLEMTVDGDDLDRPVVSDEVVLAVRRAIAAIETGAARTWPSGPGPAPVVAPPATAVTPAPALTPSVALPTGSAPLAAASPLSLVDASLGGGSERRGALDATGGATPARRSALQRLIDGLRRR